MGRGSRWVTLVALGAIMVAACPAPLARAAPADCHGTLAFIYAQHEALASSVGLGIVTLDPLMDFRLMVLARAPNDPACLPFPIVRGCDASATGGRIVYTACFNPDASCSVSAQADLCLMTMFVYERPEAQLSSVHVTMTVSWNHDFYDVSSFTRATLDCSVLAARGFTQPVCAPTSACAQTPPAASLPAASDCAATPPTPPATAAAGACDPPATVGASVNGMGACTPIPPPLVLGTCAPPYELGATLNGQGSCVPVPVTPLTLNDSLSVGSILAMRVEANASLRPTQLTNWSQDEPSAQLQDEEVALLGGAFAALGGNLVPLANAALELTDAEGLPIPLAALEGPDGAVREHTDLDTRESRTPGCVAWTNHDGLIDDPLTVCSPFLP